ncbi:MAG: small multi-drug export protein [bacterium]|nr:small multi-drug export protein [bacterium]
MRRIFFAVLFLLISVNLAAGFKESVLDFFENSNIPKEVAVMAISAIPVFELRLGLPIAIKLFEMDIKRAFLFSFLGNMLPVLPILFFLKWIYSLLGKWGATKKPVEKFKRRAEAQSKKIGKYEMLGLILFIGIPLPGTGAWTGSAAAVALEMGIGKAFVSNIVGVLMAGAIVTAFTLMGIKGAIAAGLIIGLVAAVPVLRQKI